MLPCQRISQGYFNTWVLVVDSTFWCGKDQSLGKEFTTFYMCRVRVRGWWSRWGGHGGVDIHTLGTYTQYSVGRRIKGTVSFSPSYYPWIDTSSLIPLNLAADWILRVLSILYYIILYCINHVNPSCPPCEITWNNLHRVLRISKLTT